MRSRRKTTTIKASLCAVLSVYAATLVWSNCDRCGTAHSTDVTDSGSFCTFAVFNPDKPECIGNTKRDCFMVLGGPAATGTMDIYAATNRDANGKCIGYIKVSTGPYSVPPCTDLIGCSASITDPNKSVIPQLALLTVPMR